MKISCRKASACVKVERELSENSPIGMGVKQGSITSPQLFNSFVDGCMKKL